MWLLRGFGFLYQKIMLLDSISAFLASFNLLQLFKNFRSMMTFVNVMLGSLQSLLRFTGLWLLFNFGLCFYNMALYGSHDLRYHTLMSAYTNTLYN